MGKKPAAGKKTRKFGRTGRRPCTARRKANRPDLFRKAKRVLSQNGDAQLTKWGERRCEMGDNAITVGQAMRKARSANV